METNKISNVGIDFVDKRRFSLSEDYFIKRILTKNEFLLFEKLETDFSKLNFLSSRWTSKEAVFKAIGDSNILLTNIEILNDEFGKPFCSSFENIILSTTHSEFYTITIALKLK